MNTISNEAKICIFVPFKSGTWGMKDHFKRFNPARDDEGWWFDAKYEKEVQDLCNQTGKLSIERRNLPLIAKDINDYRRQTSHNYYLEKHARLEEKMRSMLQQKGITNDRWVDNLEEHLIALSKTNDGKALVDEYRKLTEKLEAIMNDEAVAKISIQPASPTNMPTDSFHEFLTNYSEKQLRDDIKRVSPGIKTGYKIGDVDLAFPGGAISIIAAPTSHGKTTALINFGLGIIDENPNKNVYFFTYEESSAAIILSFMNVWISKKITEAGITAPLSKNSKRSIESYYRGYNYIAENMRLKFESLRAEFFETIIDTGQLKVFYLDKNTDQLVNIISFISNNDENIGAVFVDYMQLLKLPNSKQSRQEEIKDICLMLKDCAVSTGLPIVLAAQFNRTVVAEADLSPVNIGEAGDIERIASLIIGMYNRNFEMNREGNKDRSGSKIEKEPSIYFEILKGRNIGNGHASVMDFDGNRGLITKRNSTTTNNLF